MRKWTDLCILYLKYNFYGCSSVKKFKELTYFLLNFFFTKYRYLAQVSSENNILNLLHVYLMQLGVNSFYFDWTTWLRKQRMFTRFNFRKLNENLLKGESHLLDHEGYGLESFSASTFVLNTSKSSSSSSSSVHRTFFLNYGT